MTKWVLSIAEVLLLTVNAIQSYPKSSHPYLIKKRLILKQSGLAQEARSEKEEFIWNNSTDEWQFTQRLHKLAATTRVLML